MSLEINKIEEAMNKTVESLNYELGKISTGRANPSILDGITVTAYGSPSPLNQVALINVPEARQLTVKPFDPSLLKDIEAAIAGANIGINPSSDGEIIRLNVPALTEDSRKILVKEVKAAGEASKVRIRNNRQDAMNIVKKDDELTKDEMKQAENQVQEITNKFNKKIDEITSKKEDEVMTI